jgi:hypothetical protein
MKIMMFVLLLGLSFNHVVFASDIEPEVEEDVEEDYDSAEDLGCDDDEPDQEEESLEIKSKRLHKKWTDAWQEVFAINSELFKIVAENPKILELQKKLVNDDDRRVMQLKSLDQGNNDDFGETVTDTTINKYKLKCGLFVAYNFIKINEILKFGDITKFNVHIPETTSSQPLGDLAEFKSWIIISEQALKIKFNQGYKSLAEMAGEEMVETVEVSPNHIIHILQQNPTFSDSLQFVGENSIIDLQDIDQNITNIKDIGFFAFWDTDAFDYNCFANRVKSFRNNGTPLFLSILKKGHWIAVIFTTDGMYVANSIGDAPPMKEDLHIQNIYDLFVGQPDPAGLLQVPAGPLDELAEKLETLKQNLENLQNKLRELRRKLNDLRTVVSSLTTVSSQCSTPHLEEAA